MACGSMVTTRVYSKVVYLTSVTRGALTQSFTLIQIKLEFGNAGFFEEGKTGVSGEKTLVARTRTNNQLNPLMTPGSKV